ncbi:MAG: C10 family peptidase [Bacteroidales bacterium]|nr:C10 family peptidase [Bacteroidales bacterium]
MKRLLLSLLISLTFCSLTPAENVTAETAAKAARNWFSCGLTRGEAAEPQLVWTGNYSTKGPLAPPFYVFNNPGGGWIAISGDNAARPVLARSKEGAFSPATLPDIVSEWFDSYADQIDFIRAEGIRSAQAEAEWEELLAGLGATRASAVKMLVTVFWGQRTPFNNMCFMIDGALPPCGCTNTAGAEIMFYYRHPAGRELPVPGYTYTKTINGESRTFTVPGVEDSVIYDWEHMRNDTYPSGKYTTQEADAVARLISDLTVMSHTSFGPSGSGAALNNLRNGMVKYLGYDPAQKRVNRVDYSAEEWGAMMMAEIDAGRPVLYEGYNPENTSSGHAFVLDGYDSDGSFHINWGWSGSYSGATTFFAIDAFSPGTRNYNHNQHALIYMMPAAGTPTLCLDDYGIALDGSTDPLASSKFYVKAKVLNYGSNPAGGWFKIYHCDYLGNPRGPISSVWQKSSTYPVQIDPHASAEKAMWLCTNSYDYAVGDKLMLFYSRDMSEWNPLYAVENETVADCIPACDLPFIDVKADCTYENGEPLLLRIVNTRQRPDSVNWLFDGNAVTPDTGGNFRVILTSGSHRIEAEVTTGEETIKLVQEIQVL